jgi:hypothetical protein
LSSGPLHVGQRIGGPVKVVYPPLEDMRSKSSAISACHAIALAEAGVSSDPELVEGERV